MPRGMTVMRWTLSACSSRGGGQGVPYLVIGHHPPLLFAHDAALQFQAADDPVEGLLEATISTAPRSRRGRHQRDSLTTLARSEPAKPGVRAAISFKSTSGASLTLRACTLRMASRPLMSGRSTAIWRSKWPGAGWTDQSTSGTVGGAEDDYAGPGARSRPSRRATGSGSARSLPVPPEEAEQASHCRWCRSSMKTMQGAFSLACSKTSRTRAAPTPTNISMNCEPLMEKKGTSTSPATRFGQQGLTGAGQPHQQHPFGGCGRRVCGASRVLQKSVNLPPVPAWPVQARHLLRR